MHWQVVANFELERGPHRIPAYMMLVQGYTYKKYMYIVLLFCVCVCVCGVVVVVVVGVGGGGAISDESMYIY